MSEKERYATINTWEKVFKDEGTPVGRTIITKRLKAAKIVGETARISVNRLVRNGFYSESDVRGVCSDLLDRLQPSYFMNSDNIRSDLETLAKMASDRSGRSIKPKDLNVWTIRFPFTLTSGESMSGHSYLLAAAKALGKAGNKKEAQKVFREVLAMLKKSAGFEVKMDQQKKYPTLGTNYFKDPAKVRTDLESLARAASSKTDKDVHARNLNMSHVKNSFTVTTGESMSVATYTNRAARALKMANDVKEAARVRKEVFTLLMQTAGFEVAEFPTLDEAYFDNTENVRTDLESLAGIVSLKKGKSIRPEYLNTGHVRTSFTLTTGESMHGHTYLRRAAEALYEAADGVEIRRTEVLARLKQIAGFDSES